MEKKEGNVFVVGIGGVSNGGKTTLAEGLGRCLENEEFNVTVIHQDIYFKEEKDVPLHESGEFGRWDEMIAFDMDTMVKDVKNIIEKMKNTEKSSVLIIEGILIFNHRELNSLFNMRFVFTLTKEEAKKRRLTREYEPSDTPNIFEYHVWPMYIQYLAELRKIKVNFNELDGEISQQKILQQVKSKVMNSFPKENGFS
uniref:nicotinamide riboside kinase 1-like n=1 Tax=Styela clava TaxID=7725 RepID=UPI00193A2DC2|nr:nicotinamide riboside kinase 1-like [Styela clava]